MTPLLVTISSGSGPIETRQFVRRLSDALAIEIVRRGALLESTRFHGPSDAPGSIDLAVRAERVWLTDLIGTHALVMRSERRPKRDRKRWYVGVCCVDRDDLRAPTLEVRDVVFETCRASGAGGQHVNKTESAVRAHHLPSGLSVRIENERSQHRNKRRALDELARMLAHRADTSLAHAEGARRARSLQVERGAAVMTWCLEHEKLVRVRAHGLSGV